MAHFTLPAFVLQLSGVICVNIPQREGKGKERKGAAGTSAIRKAATATKGPECTANMTPQSLIFLAGWDEISIHYGMNLHPNPLYPTLAPLQPHHPSLHAIYPPTLSPEPVLALIASIETIG